MSTTNLLEVPVMSLQVTMWLASFCAMLWVQNAMLGSSRHHMLSVPEAELVQPQWAEGSAMKSWACSGSGESSVAGTIPSQCPALPLEMCLRTGPLGFASQRPYPGSLSILCG